MAEVKVTPTNPAQSAPERKRRSFVSGGRKFEIPGMVGDFLQIKGVWYRIHVFRGTPDRLAYALEGGYEFCSADELHINGVGIGDDALKSGNTDMGSRVSVVAGGELTSDNQALRLYVMKKRRDWYEEDLAEDHTAENTIRALSAGMAGGPAPAGADPSLRYTGSAVKGPVKLPEMFKAKPQR